MKTNDERRINCRTDRENIRIHLCPMLGSICSQIYLLRNTNSKTSGLPNVDILRIVLALQLRPLGLLVLDDVFKHTLGSASLSLAALLALRTKSVG